MSCPSCERPDGTGTGPAKRILRTGLLADPIYKEHRPERSHPESPDRCDAILKALADAKLNTKLKPLKPRAATEEELLLCHERSYIEIVKRDVAAGALRLSTGDTPLSEKSFDVALMAVGGALAAVDAVVAGKVKNAFCVVRPPGHHTTARRGMGFCIFNNIAIAARYAQKTHELGKVLIFDWDVHHGNGTQQIFYEDGSVFYCSIHQWPWYPGSGRTDETGQGAGKGTNLNLPFAAGATAKEVFTALNEKFIPAADKFKPDLVLVSAGFDSHAGDPLGGLTLTDDDFAELTRLALGVASRHARGRLVSVLEGGYDLAVLASASVAHVKALMSA